jgi:hypothetical protein
MAHLSSEVSYRVESAFSKVLDLYLSIPPGSVARGKSRFGDAYAANSLLLLGAGCVSFALWTRNSLFALAGSAFILSSVYLALLRDDSARSFESELPFLMVLSSFYSSAGHRGIEAALESIASSSGEVFRGLGQARLSYLKERLYSAPTPAKALERFAERQKDKELSQVVDGYRTVAATGGNAYAYLVQQTDRSLSRFEETRLERVRTTRSIAEVLLLTLALAPSIALTISIVGLNGGYTLFVLTASLPVASLLALAMVDLYLPTVRDRTGVSWGLPAGLAAGALTLYLLRGFGSLPLSLTAGSVAVLLPLSLQYQLDTISARRDERGALAMITSLVEALRIGKSVHEALAEASADGHLSSFEGLVREFGLQVSLGVPPPEAGARVDSKSWVTRASFIIIGHSMVLGGGLEIVERFRSFLLRYIDSWAAVRREALWTVALSASLPFVTLGGVSVISSLQSGFTASVEQPAVAVSLQALPLQSVLLAFVEVSALAAIVSSKLAGLTIKAAPVALATMAATLASLIIYGLV